MDQKTGTGFVNLQNFLAANKTALGRETDMLAGNARAAGQDARAADDAVAQAAYNQAKANGTGNTFDATSLPDYATAQEKSQNAYERLQNLADPTGGGLQDQLQQTYGGQGYGPGQRSFDAGLLQNSQNAKSEFKAAANKFGDLRDYLGNTTAAQQQAGYGASGTTLSSPRVNWTSVDPNGPIALAPQGSGGAGVNRDYVKPFNGINQHKATANGASSHEFTDDPAKTRGF